MKIAAPPAPPTIAAPSPEGATAKRSEKDEVGKVARDFEAILLRQMLDHAHVAGKGGGYADMAVEALATSIGAAGGLGMGRAIEAALSRSAAPPPEKK